MDITSFLGRIPFFERFFDNGQFPFADFSSSSLRLGIQPQLFALRDVWIP